LIDHSFGFSEPLCLAFDCIVLSSRFFAERCLNTCSRASIAATTDFFTVAIDPAAARRGSGTIDAARRRAARLIVRGRANNGASGTTNNTASKSAARRAGGCATDESTCASAEKAAGQRAALGEGWGGGQHHESEGSGKMFGHDMMSFCRMLKKTKARPWPRSPAMFSYNTMGMRVCAVPVCRLVTL